MLSTAPHAVITLEDGRMVVLYVRTEIKISLSEKKVAHYSYTFCAAIEIIHACMYIIMV